MCIFPSPPKPPEAKMPVAPTPPPPPEPVQTAPTPLPTTPTPKPVTTDQTKTAAEVVANKAAGGDKKTAGTSQLQSKPDAGGTNTPTTGQGVNTLGTIKKKNNQTGTNY